MNASNVLIIVDSGHSKFTAGKRTPPFADGTVVQEYQFNRPTALMILRLAESKGFATRFINPEEEDVPIAERRRRRDDAYEAFKVIHPDGVVVFISIHYNAHVATWDGSKARGVEVLFPVDSPESYALADAIYTEIMKGTSQVGRGLKGRTDVGIIKYGRMPCVLVENGFMDDEYEAGLMLNEAYQNEQAAQVLNGVINCYKVVCIDEIKALMTGDRGSEVKAMQSKFLQQGYVVDVDGIFGPKTAMVVKRFQRDNRLPVTGIADFQTLIELGQGGIPPYQVVNYDKQTVIVKISKASIDRIDCMDSIGKFESPRKAWHRLVKKPRLLMNGSVFDTRDGREYSRFIDEGKIIIPNGYSKFGLIVKKNGKFHFGDINVSDSTIRDAIGGSPALIKNGQIAIDYSLDYSFMNARHPRLAIGENEDFIFVVIIHGRRFSLGHYGVTIKEFAEILLKIGCTNAINLDGGGSICVIDEKGKLVNMILGERSTANFIAIY